jgi:hypothetical protein
VGPLAHEHEPSNASSADQAPKRIKPAHQRRRSHLVQGPTQTARKSVRLLRTRGTLFGKPFVSRVGKLGVGSLGNPLKTGEWEKHPGAATVHHGIGQPPSPPQVKMALLPHRHEKSHILVNLNFWPLQSPRSEKKAPWAIAFQLLVRRPSQTTVEAQISPRSNPKSCHSPSQPYHIMPGKSGFALKNQETLLISDLGLSKPPKTARKRL